MKSDVSDCIEYIVKLKRGETISIWHSDYMRCQKWLEPYIDLTMTVYNTISGKVTVVPKGARDIWPR